MIAIPSLPAFGYLYLWLLITELTLVDLLSTAVYVCICLWTISERILVKKGVNFEGAHCVTLS